VVILEKNEPLAKPAAMVVNKEVQRGYYFHFFGGKRV